MTCLVCRDLAQALIRASNDLTKAQHILEDYPSGPNRDAAFRRADTYKAADRAWMSHRETHEVSA